MMKQANSGINPADLVDRISYLPDSILSLILSYIPTKNAVATSLLSKRWKSLWKAVHNLDFKLDFCSKFCIDIFHKKCRSRRGCSIDKNMKFASFVSHVLLLHDGGFLNKFSLVWKPICIPSQVISWISTAITRNVHELFLCVNKCQEPFEIPSSVFGCEALKSLTLDGNMFVSDSIAVCLPRLERLTLVSIYFQCHETFQKLISGCPELNLLYIKMVVDIMTEYFCDTYRGNLFTFIISSTSLRHFTLDVEVEPEIYEFSPYCSVEFEAPSLEYLMIEGFVPRICVQESLNSLVKADISTTMSQGQLYDANICNSLVEAIRAFDCAKSLRLSEFVLSALSRATIGLSTKFKRLTKLKTEATCCYCSSMQDLIQSSDSLEMLIVYKGLYYEDYYNYLHTHSHWTALVEVPRCLSNSLKTVEIDDYGGFYHEREMINYMLMHGSALEVMKINGTFEKDDSKLELLQKISDFPRKSPTCKVSINRWG